MSIVTAAALVFGIVFATADEASQNVKNKTAAGQYGYEDAYYGQNFYDDFDYNIYNYARNTLINTHVCSIDVSYAVFPHWHHSRKRYRHPVIKECSDAFTGVFDRSKVDNGYSSTSCDRCCKVAARLDRVTESEVVGMVLILHRKAKCACCAPYRPYETSPLYYPTYPLYQPLHQQPQQPKS